MSTLFEKMTAIADNIRSLLGLTEKLGLDAMTENLETANTEVESQTEIIEQLRAVISEKAGKPLGGSIDDLIDGSITEVVSNATKVRAYGLYDFDSIEKITLPIATVIQTYACSYSIGLKEVNAPMVETIEDMGAFESCTKLETINFPKVTYVGRNAFYGCKALTKVILPSVTSFGTFAFQNCTELVCIDLPIITELSAGVFYMCSKLTRLILRKSNSICTLANTNTLQSTPIASGTGYIYVPRALVEDYKVATNWTTYANQFRALEDYTVDGTITGELDESKI